MPEHMEDDDTDILDERRTRISDVLKEQGDSVLYVYDLGDDWRHEVVLEKILPPPAYNGAPGVIIRRTPLPTGERGWHVGVRGILGSHFQPPPRRVRAQ